MRRLLLLALLLPALVACGDKASGGKVTMDPPATGQCRELKRADLAKRSNDSSPVACTEPHNAETFASGVLPEEFARTSYDDSSLDQWAYQTCGTALREHLGINESTLMRTLLTWVWFRPSEEAWSAGARWYRCDLLAGGAGSRRYLDLPTTTKGLLAEGPPDDHWMTCARGSDPEHGAKVPCSKQHAWRAVTTIKLGEPTDPYPGDDAVKQTSSDYCASSVQGWLGYPEDYEYAYTWFGQAEWQAGNRRSVCWAATSE
ncbi:septum formation family protein [Nocardioides sp.]|uniref:septum formation family protein n=1 Tax=Nocardioides sp. TaxID=35761 RepID=UPI0039E3C69E